MSEAAAALADAVPRSYWHDLHQATPTTPPLTAPAAAELVVVGAGFTGLWTAIAAKRREPDRDVLVLDANHVGYGGTGRNGGFVSDSLTHGLAHGLARWPDDFDGITARGRANLADLCADVAAQEIRADVRLTGKTLVATTVHQASELAELAKLMADHGEEVELLDETAVRDDICSPTYRGGLRIRSGGGTLDPVGLVHGLRDWALRLGVRLHEGTMVSAVEPGAVTTPRGRVHAHRIALATNAYAAPMRRLWKYVVPVYDHVLVTEPLTEAQWKSVGWVEGQGVTDAGNQFHYYRPLADGRILWGGYDAIYYFGSSTAVANEQRDASHRMLAEHFFATFPQLEGLRFTHRWAGLIDTSSRFVPYVGVDRTGTIGHAIGFTGLGVGYSRYAGGAMLDALDGGDVPAFLAERPMPFPPEPLRYLAVQSTRAALAREDRTGRRGVWLRLLDRFGVGFNS